MTWLYEVSFSDVAFARVYSNFKDAKYPKSALITTAIGIRRVFALRGRGRPSNLAPMYTPIWGVGRNAHPAVAQES